ncbi:MAG: ABC transporter substrate-binding protein [Planctomycetes bacterium]|nr:ABC transporter substrate-binding protein [Planctomycetota bacterium]
MKYACMFLALAAVLTGCGDDASETPEPPLLNVGHVGHDHQIALYIAALKGRQFLDRYGVGLLPVRDGEVYDLVEGESTLARLRLLKVGGGSRMPAALSRGEIDVGLGGVPAVVNLADDSDVSRGVKIICPLQTDGDMLVMQPDSPVHSWAEFLAEAKRRGRPLVIGYKAPLAVALLVFQGALDAANITWSTQDADDVQVVLHNMRGGRNAIPLITGGTLDGFIMNQPVPAIAEHKGVGKVVASLRDLPPAGKWEDHPCCCVCATGEAFSKHPDALRALLKCIHLGDAYIAAQPAEAAALAATWIKTPPEVERASVPTISYGTLPTDRWRAGLLTWLELMAERDYFTGRFADAPPQDVAAAVCDFTLCNEAAEQLRPTGRLQEAP